MATVRTAGRKKITVTIGASATPISNLLGVPVNLYCTDFEVWFPSTNAGTYCYIGNSTVDATWIPRVKQKNYNFVQGTGSIGGTIPEEGFNLGKIYIFGTQNDTAIVEYMAHDQTTT